LKRGLRYSADCTWVAAELPLCCTLDAFWAVLHGLAPLSKSALEGIVDEGVEFIGIGLNKAEVEHRVSRLFCLVALLPLCSFGLHLTLDILDVLEGLLKVILATLAIVILLLDELERTETQATILVRLGKEADRLTLGAQTADGLLVGDVELSGLRFV